MGCCQSKYQGCKCLDEGCKDYEKQIKSQNSTQRASQQTTTNTKFNLNIFQNKCKCECCVSFHDELHTEFCSKDKKDSSVFQGCSCRRKCNCEFCQHFHEELHPEFCQKQGKLECPHLLGKAKDSLCNRMNRDCECCLGIEQPKNKCNYLTSCCYKECNHECVVCQSFGDGQKSGSIKSTSIQGTTIEYRNTNRREFLCELCQFQHDMYWENYSKNASCIHQCKERCLLKECQFTKLDSKHQDFHRHVCPFACIHKCCNKGEHNCQCSTEYNPVTQERETSLCSSNRVIVDILLKEKHLKRCSDSSYNNSSFTESQGTSTQPVVQRPQDNKEPVTNGHQGQIHDSNRSPFSNKAQTNSGDDQICDLQFDDLNQQNCQTREQGQVQSSNTANLNQQNAGNQVGNSALENDKSANIHPPQPINQIPNPKYIQPIQKIDDHIIKTLANKNFDYLIQLPQAPQPLINQDPINQDILNPPQQLQDLQPEQNADNQITDNLLQPEINRDQLDLSILQPFIKPQPIPKSQPLEQIIKPPPKIEEVPKDQVLNKNLSIDEKPDDLGLLQKQLSGNQQINSSSQYNQQQQGDDEIILDDTNINELMQGQYNVVVETSNYQQQIVHQGIPEDIQLTNIQENQQGQTSNQQQDNKQIVDLSQQKVHQNSQQNQQQQGDQVPDNEEIIFDNDDLNNFNIGQPQNQVQQSQIDQVVHQGNQDDVQPSKVQDNQQSQIVNQSQDNKNINQESQQKQLKTSQQNQQQQGDSIPEEEEIIINNDELNEFNIGQPKEQVQTSQQGQVVHQGNADVNNNEHQEEVKQKNDQQKSVQFQDQPQKIKSIDQTENQEDAGQGEEQDGIVSAEGQEQEEPVESTEGSISKSGKKKKKKKKKKTKFVIVSI